MKLVFPSMLGVVFIGACAAQATEHHELMVQIESTITLPEGARPIDQYSRNYALRPDGKVVAIYVRPWSSAWENSDDYGCEVVLADFETRPCTAEEMAEMKQRDKATAAEFGIADESRWFDDYLELPSINDGGCDQVNIVIDPLSLKVESANCNGLA